MSEKRARWLITWMTAQADNGATDLADFAAVLGRLCFAMGPLEFLRPFVAPLFAWSASMGHGGRAPLSWAVSFLLRFLSRELEGDGRVEQVRAVGKDLGIAFRADAKAEGQEVRIGGWECFGGTLPGAARWFSIELTRKTAPWAFARGEPYRAIAALELFATLMCIILFGDAWPAGASGEVKLQGLTDNAGNSFVVTRLMTTKFPLVLVLAEVAAQLRSRGMALHLGWAPRDQNEEADALTNGDFGQFNPERRITPALGILPFLVLPDLADVADGIYREVQARKTAGVTPAPAVPARKSLRLREPWA